MSSKDDHLHLRRPIKVDAVIGNIKTHYEKNLIYTNVGSMINLTVNPRKPLDSNSELNQQLYLDHARQTAPDRLPLPSHLFGLADKVYTRMTKEQQDQSIVLCGDALSGKSENRKTLVNQLCLLATKPKKSKSLKLMQSVKKSESIYEAFGHYSATNSSGFSRYTELQYDVKGKLIGVKTLDYMLEKRRVASTTGPNFNIFYMLIKGATPDERSFWKLSKGIQLPNRQDDSLAIKMSQLRDHMKSVGIGRRTQSEIFNLVAAVLHLGNIEFVDDPTRPQDACEVKNAATLQFVADLLGVSENDLSLALTYQTKLIKKEQCTVFLNAADAEKQRDDFAITLYGLLFSWLVERLNSRFCREDCHTFIGILDFCGAALDKKSTFDDLLTNFGLEKIQKFVIDRIIRDNVDQMKKDKVLNQNAPLPGFETNEKEVEFLRKLLKAVDEESVRVNSRAALGESAEASSGARLFDHLNEKFSRSEMFHSADGQTFSLKHHFGTVEYDTTNMVNDNLDPLCLDFVSLCKGDEVKNIKESDDPLVRELFSEKLVSTRSHWRNSSVLVGATLPHKPKREPSIRRKRGAAARRDDDMLQTSSRSFQESLDVLLGTLEQTVSWFVFSLNPNSDKTGDSFNTSHITRQLEHYFIADILQARLHCNDYSVIMPVEEFLERFRSIVDVVLEDSMPSSKMTRADQFCKASGWNSSDYAIGNYSHNIYLAESAYRALIDEVKDNEERAKRELREARNAAKSGMWTDDGSLYESEVEFSEYEPSYAGDSDSDMQSVMHMRKARMGRMQQAIVDEEIGKANVVSAQEERKSTRARKNWVCFAWLVTCCIPPFCLSKCGKMKRRDIQIAWREKVALCFLIFLMCCGLIFFIIVFGKLICPQQAVLSTFELRSRKDINDVWTYAYGRIFQTNGLVADHLSSYNIPKYNWEGFLGNDVSELFYKVPLWNRYCPDIPAPTPATWDNVQKRQPASSIVYPHRGIDPVSGSQKLYLEYLNNYAKGRVAWDWTYIQKTASQTTKLVVIFGNVYDVSTYFATNNKPFGDAFNTLFSDMVGKDATSAFLQLYNIPSVGKDKANAVLRCMNEMFYIGVIDNRASPQCQLSNYILLAASLLIVAVILVKFLAALQFGQKSYPEEHDKFVILQVPCYTEGPESLTRSLESLAALKYDDKRKLIFVICDGMIIGSGNDRPTPRIVLDILGVDPNIDPEPLSFESLGEGDAVHNMGKVYSGLYEIQGRSVPFIVVVKVGKPTERQRPGNRGKRDSQMLLMRFLNRVHFNAAMSPLELELYHQLRNVIGVNPSFYEYILMVDADTEVFPEALNRMISSMMHDSKISGLCGETLLSNEKDSFTTMIQVYEYFISHHLAKAFESLFGSVTCKSAANQGLPGCFCMYRIRTPSKNIPLLIAPAIIADYSENQVDTLHLKNLLHLGEDRYLTTLMMKHFPSYKLTFTAEAKCQTNAPDRWRVLLSQRRRWINSTVHNLLELVFLPELCGFCCFSLRFVVFLDLFSTVVQPALVFYIGYLIYAGVNASYNSIVTSEVFPIVSIIMLVGIYGLQVIIFLLKRQWAMIMWMFIYLLALPIFSFYIPLYAFWHFDDFSWGKTRATVGADGKKIIYTQEKSYDTKEIVLKKWGEHESEAWERGSIASKSSRQPSNYGTSTSIDYKRKSSESNASSLAYRHSTLSGEATPPIPASPRPRVVVPPPYENRLSTHSMHSPLQNDNRLSLNSPGVLNENRKSYQNTPRSGSPLPNSNRISMLSMGSYTSAPVIGSPQLGPMPSDDEIMFHIRRILSTANLMTVTKKNVREELGGLFQCDLSSKKAFINACIDDVLKGK